MNILSTSFRNFTLTAVISALACGGDKAATDESGTGATANETSSSGDAGSVEPTSGPLVLTAADLNGFEKGIARETELVREAAAKASAATTPADRGAAIQSGFEINTIPAAAAVTGLSPDRYKLVRETLSTLFTTLDFQGQIDGPQSVDTARAGPELKARLASDPYSALDPAGAAELKARLDRIVPLWLAYIGLTAVSG